MNKNITRTRESATVSLFEVNAGSLECVVAAQGKAESTVKSVSIDNVTAGQGASVMALSF